MPDSGVSKLVPRLGSSTISLSSSGVDASEVDIREDMEDDDVMAIDDDDEDGDGDGNDDEDDDDDGLRCSIEAAFAAAAWTSRGEEEAGRGKEEASSGKLRMAELPLMLKAATSWARAAISGVEKVPSHIRDFLRGSRISDTHLPQVRIRTPLYTGCLLLSLPPLGLS